MVKRITLSAVNAAMKRTMWALGDDVLCDLCRKHPHHKDPGAIAIKLLFIGRTYAAAIERRKDRLDRYKSNEEFYERRVVPAIRRSRSTSGSRAPSARSPVHLRLCAWR
jgi:hypothetical protein